jgi:hypothetical protein
MDSFGHPHQLGGDLIQELGHIVPNLLRVYFHPALGRMPYQGCMAVGQVHLCVLVFRRDNAAARFHVLHGVFSFAKNMNPQLS